VFIRLFKSLFLLLCLSASHAFASDYYVLPKAYYDSIAGRWIYGKKIRIKDKKIVAIESKGQSSKLPIVDLHDSFLLPGLIDAHAHLFFTQTKADSSFENALQREARLAPAFRMERARTFLKDYLKEGFTTIFDLGNSGHFLDVKLRDEVSLNENYPLLLVSGPGLSNANGQFPTSASAELSGAEYTLINERKPDWKKILTPYRKNHVEILKIYFDNDPSPGGLSAEEARSILQAAGTHFKKITAHAITSSSMEKTLASGFGHVEHASQFLVDKRMKNFFVTLTGIDRTTLIEFDYFKEPFYQFQLKVAKELAKNENKILFGPDFYFHSETSGFSRAKKVKQTLDFFKEAGFSNKEILSAMTYHPALSVKMDHQIGVIRKGAMANLIVLKKDPLVDINALKKIECVINKGQNFCPAGAP